jgi:mono/diheme cytochrome c family protein
VSCHGENGQLGNSGAKDLSTSLLSDEEIREILNEGKGAMPPILELMANPKHMDSVIQHIKTLRKK